MVFYAYRKFYLPLILGIIYSFTDFVIIQAQHECAITDNPSILDLCSAMPGEEFHFPTELSQFRKIREKLQNPQYEVWLLNSGDWVKVLNTRQINNISPQGIAFEAAINPANLEEFECFHICKDNPCKFKGTGFCTAHHKAVNFHHITSISIRHSDPEGQAPVAVPPKDNPIAPKAPLLKDNLPSASPRSVVVGSKYLYLSIFVIGVGLALKFKTALQEFDFGSLLEGQLETWITKGLDCTIGLVVRVESAVVKSVATTLWGDYHKWVWAPDRPIFPWVLRALYLGFFLFRKHSWWARILPRKPWWFNVNIIRPKAPDPTPSSTWNPSSTSSKVSKSPSEIAFDLGTVSCQANVVTFIHEGRSRTLGADICDEFAHRSFFLVPEDQPPPGGSHSGSEPVFLCNYHSSIYLSLKGKKLCTELDCLTLLSSHQTESKCVAHLQPAAVPVPKRPSTSGLVPPQAKQNVKFNDTDPLGDHPNDPSTGLTHMSPKLIQQAIQEAWGLGIRAELDVSRHLTALFGGSLLENAALIEQHWPLLGPQRDHAQPPVPTPSQNPVRTSPQIAEPFSTQRVNPFMATTLSSPTITTVPNPLLKGGGGSAPSLGPGVIPPQPTVNTPLRTSPFSDAFQSTVCHHLDKIAYPDVTPAKDGTFESIKRLEEIWVFCARGFDSFPVHLCPGIVGKQLAIQLKALNVQLWKLHEILAIPVALTNKLCLGAASLAWGGSDTDGAWVLGEQDFHTWSPADLDKYKPPSDWTIEPKKPKSVNLETWRRNALNQALVFALLYGNVANTDMPHLEPRRVAIEKLYQLHLSHPNKFTLKFVLETWAALNSRWVLSLKENVNRLCLLRKVERPTFEELKETGLSLDPYGNNIYSLPNTFDLDSPGEYFQSQILGALERDFDRTRWDVYRRSPVPLGTRNAGEIPPEKALVYGPNMTLKERRICALNSPKTTQGHIICWDHNSHMGCTKVPCVRCDNGGKVGIRNYETVCTPLKIYLAKGGGVQRTQKNTCRRNFQKNSQI